MERPFIAHWSGKTACILQDALFMSNERFAEHLDLAARSVAEWHKDPEMVQQLRVQKILSIAYQGASAATVERFAQLLAADGQAVPAASPPAAPGIDPVVAQMAADMALMQARMDRMQEQLGALALQLLTSGEPGNYPA